MINIYKKIWSLLDKNEKKKSSVLLMLMIIVGIVEVVGVGSIMPFLAVLGDPAIIEKNAYLSYTYDLLEFESTKSFLIFLGVSAIVILLFSAALRTLTYYGLFRFSNMRRHNIGKKLLLKYMQQPYSFFLNKNSSLISKVILSETDLAINQVIIPAIQLLTYLIIAIFLMSFLIFVDPFLAFILMSVFGGFYSVMYLSIRKYLTKIGTEREVANSLRFKLISEIIGGIKDIKLLGKENVYTSSYEKPSYMFSHNNSISQTLSNVPQFLIEVIAFGALLTMAMYALNNSSNGLGGILPILGLYALGALKLKPAFNQVYSSLSIIKFGSASLDKIIEEFSELSYEGKIFNHEKKMVLNNRLELKAVDFKYPSSNSNSLSNINLTISANTSVGIIGTTGAGKSTLLDVILGLLEASSGDIIIDNQILNENNKREWQNSIGYVPQSIFLIDDTISSNIAFGIDKDKIDHEKIKEVSKMAKVDDFISTLEDKYEAQIGERGIRLSGGQKQRIGIARALYHEPSVLVLDEATSALDIQTEKEVMDAIESLSGTKTIIMIAHRLSTVEKCDVIVKMEHGKILEVIERGLDK